MDDLKYTPKDPDRLQYKVDQKLKTKRRYEEDEEFLDKERHYQDKVQIPVLPKDEIVPDNGRKTILLGLYSEICNGWRTLTDVRFKLLGLLPLVSGVLLFSILSKKNNAYPISALGQLAIAMFGLAVTIGLLIYDLRNSQLYDDLIGRGRQLENELGVHTGHFRGRPKSSGLVRHDIGLKIVYYSSILSWIGILAFAITRLFCKT